jgi:5-methylcytosine-specific restriction endonuclease McrA
VALTQAERYRRYQERNPGRKAAQQWALKQKVNAYCAEVKARYGCQNPGCPWTGPYEPCQLDFDHIDPATKKVGVSQATSLGQAKREINRCRVLCSNCHRALTHGLLTLPHTIKCNEVDQEDTERM